MDIDERIQALHVNIESLHASLGELYDTVRNVGETVGDIGQALSAVHGATQNLLNITTAHEKRLDRHEVTVVAFQEDVREIKTELRAIRERLEGFGHGSKFN